MDDKSVNSGEGSPSPVERENTMRGSALKQREESWVVSLRRYGGARRGRAQYLDVYKKWAE